MAMRFMRRLEALLYGMALYPVEGSEEVKGQIAEVRRPSSTGVAKLRVFSLCNLTSNLRAVCGAGGWAATMPEEETESREEVRGPGRRWLPYADE
jgi:hypothetical protein